MAGKFGNALSPSTASPERKVFNNLPGLYPTEDWVAYYWSVNEEGKLEERRAVVQLPLGFSKVCPEIEVGQNGCILHVRRWGFGCYPSLLEEMGFDFTPLLSHDRSLFPDDEHEIMHLAFKITHFELPGFFIIASDEHPFLLFDPEGTLKGSYTRWYTYLGALAYIVSGGKVGCGFIKLEKEMKRLYQEAVLILKAAMEEAK